MADEVESLDEMTNILNQEDEELEVKEPKKETKEKEKKEEEEIEEEEKEKEDEEEKEGSEEEEEETTGKERKETRGEIPQYKEVTKKYPTLFKDFPHLKHVFFHEREYRELFPTVDDAREASESLENLKEIERAVSDGEVLKVLKAFEPLGENAVANFAGNFLPSVRKMNQDLYYQVITPELVNYTKSLYNAGVRNENDNLKNAALVLSLHLFGDPKVATGEKEVKTAEVKKSKEKDSELEKERTSFRQERYTALYNDVITNADSQLVELIEDGIDPKNTMTTGVKELVVQKVLKEIDKALDADSIHKNKMNSLWRKASQDNFSNSWRSKIVSAYLNAAEEIMPRIRAKVRANVLGIRERPPEKKENGEVKHRVEPKGTSSGGRGQSSNGKHVDSKKVDWNKTSDIDFLKDNVTLKKE